MGTQEQINKIEQLQQQGWATGRKPQVTHYYSGKILMVEGEEAFLTSIGF